ncbi:MAG TPA: hypothetical protein VFT62_10365 [Mycobacteriales bacterium]|nr:hypothetical protein [Mycobacteriales bacterium]
MRRWVNALIAVFAAALIAGPGVAFATNHAPGGGGGNGTPSPPPSSPPCDSDGHNGTPPPYGGGSGDNGHGKGPKCNSTSGTSTSGTSTSGTSTSGTSTSGTSTSGTSTSGTSSDICDTGGALMPETIGDAVADGILGSPLGNVGGLVQDPHANGPLSGPLAQNIPAPLGTELGCLVNVVDLPPGPPGL